METEMTPRERMLETLLFGRPDRIPFQPGWPRESTLKAWRSQGLPAEGNWAGHLFRTIGLTPEPPSDEPGLGVDFRMIPQFEEKVLEHRDGHYVVQDWKGNVCEISDTFDVTYLRLAKDFVTRRWIQCPVEAAADWDAMKARYRIDAPGRFPADFDDRCRRLADRRRFLTVSFNGPFWQLREWCGFEGLCFLMADQPAFVDAMAAFWKDFVAAALERVLSRLTPDCVFFSEDMAYKAHAMISPAMVRRFCMPCWRAWSDQARAAGVKAIGVDSDGCIDELIPLWIEAGVNWTEPVEVAAHNDLPAFRQRFGQRMAYRGGVDKRAMAKGGKALRDELARLEPVVRAGGYIPGCDHGVPSDVSWPDFVEYARQLARMTGWL